MLARPVVEASSREALIAGPAVGDLRLRSAIDVELLSRRPGQFCLTLSHTPQDALLLRSSRLGLGPQGFEHRVLDARFVFAQLPASKAIAITHLDIVIPCAALPSLT